jgi:hypothetical protein
MLAILIGIVPDFPQSHQENAGIVPELLNELFIPNTFQFISHPKI